MPITLNTYTFDPARTTVREDQQEIAGQDGRTIRINGLLQGFDDLPTLEAALDAILAAASSDTALLSLRPNRQLRVRREKFTREIQRDARTACFELILQAEDPFEQSTTTYTWPWALTASGQHKTVISTGSAPSPVLITLQATGALINPAFSDGTRTIAYTGTLSPGTVLEFDGILREVRLNGTDVTPYATGDFPEATPGNTLFTYTDDAASAHTAQASIAFNLRWW